MIWTAASHLIYLMKLLGFRQDEGKLTFRNQQSKGYDDSAGSHRDERQSRQDDNGGGKFRKYFVEPFLSSRNPPWFDARGVAVGIFIGLGIPVGTQIVMLGLLRLLFRFNTIVAFACTCVNNPITIIPMYYGYYCLGSLMLGRQLIMSAEDFESLMRPILQAQHFWNSAQAFVYWGWDIVERWFVAALSVSAASGLIGYVVSYRLWMRRCRKKAARLGITYGELLSKLEGSVEREEKGQD
jgi:uncharacterized protein (DUF2062 family)